MQFPINSRVKLSMWTGDTQIDYYHDHPLEVIEYREIEYFDFERDNAPPWAWRVKKTIPNYTLVAPDGVVITANEYELEAL